METNNQKLPLIPTPPSLNMPSPPKPPGSPFSPKKTENVNFIQPAVATNQNKRVIVLTVAFITIALIVCGILAATALRKDANNIQVSGDQVSMSWKDMNISAQLAPKETISFMTNGGQMDSRNTGNFGVIPMEKVKYLEQKYTDFIHCDSPGESEAKSLEFNMEMFTNTASAEIEMKKINELVKKGNLVVFEVDGSQLQQMQINQAEKNVQMMSSQLAFYLVDNVRIIQENYR